MNRLRPLALFAALALALPAPAVAARIVVGLRPAASDALRAGARPALERLRAAGLTPRRSLADGVPLAAARANPRTTLRLEASRAGAARDPFGLDPSNVWLFDAADSAAALGALAADPDVEWYEPERIRTLADAPAAAFDAAPPDPLAVPLWAAAAGDSFVPNDPHFVDGRQWALRNLGPASAYRGVLGADVHAVEAWALTTGSNDVRLAIADTGVDPLHPELGGAMPDGSPRIEFPFVATEEFNTTVADSFGHGTPVAGVALARTNNGAFSDSLGVAGVCGGDGGANAGCRFVPIRITPGRSGEASSFDIARAFLWAAAHGARAVNLSFASEGPSRAERVAMHWALTHGCVPVVAAGNSAYLDPQPVIYPAAYSQYGFGIQVGATDPFDTRPSWSSFNAGLDLVAPGWLVWSTFMTYPSAMGVRRNGYVAGGGTSFAAPFVTGAVGLLAAWRPELQDVDFQHLLRESADDIGAPGVDAETGHGRLDVARALRAVPPTFGVWHDEVAAVVVSDTSDAGSLPTDSLVVGESGPGTMMRPRVWHDARLVEVRATIAIPDTFVDSVRVWPRVGGTFAVAPGFRLPFFAPYAEVVAQSARSFTLRGWLYRLPASCEACGEDGWLPLPPDQARFGFTVIGRVARPMPATPAAANAAALRVTPNPFVARARIEAPRGAAIEILDVTGRRVRAARVPDAAAWEWDGADDHGARVPAGLYFARVRSAGATRTARLVRLER